MTNTETINVKPAGYYQACKAVISAQKPNNSFVQRQLNIPYPDAQRIIRIMEQDGVISEENAEGQRTVLVTEAPTPPDPYGPTTEIVATVLEAAMGHNSDREVPLLAGSDSLSEAARDKLRLTVERIERLEEEKKEVAESIKEVKSEAKALGYDVKALNQVIKLRKMDREERQEREAILEVYLDALGEL